MPLGNNLFSDVETIYLLFVGTIEQWNAIDKSDYWQSGSYEAPVVKIICSDGTLNSK